MSVPREHDWRRNQAAVTVAAFIGVTGFTLVMPFLPLYFEDLGVDSPGAAAIWSGVSLGVTPAVTAVMAPIWARVAERFGKKLMVVRSLASFVVIMSLMALVTAPWQVLALRALQGLFAGYGPIAMTMAAESAPANKVAAAIGWVQTAQRLGPALGPVIGGTLAATFGLRETFFVAAGCFVIAFVLVVVAYQEPKRQRPRADAAADAPMTWARLRLVPHFVLLLGAVFGLQLIDRSFGPILPLYLRDAGHPPDAIPFLSGTLFAAMAGSAAIGNQFTRRLLARWPAPVLLPWCVTAAAVAAMVFGLSSRLPLLFPAVAVFGLGIGVATTAIYTAATTAVGPAARGVAFGYLTTAYLTGLALSPVTSGLVGALSIRVVFVADALGLATVAWLLATRMRATG